MLKALQACCFKKNIVKQKYQSCDKEAFLLLCVATVGIDKFVKSKNLYLQQMKALGILYAFKESASLQ